jgi:hypothetical protein
MDRVFVAFSDLNFVNSLKSDFPKYKSEIATKTLSIILLG